MIYTLEYVMSKTDCNNVTLTYNNKNNNDNYDTKLFIIIIIYFILD